MPVTSPPVLSVIMPVYNARGTILRAVRSILASDFRSFEFLIVDDGSTDGTREVLAELKDPRVRVITGLHEGVAAAANTAIAQSQAAIIARMDADDLATADRLGKQFRYLQGSEMDAVGGRVRVVDLDGNPVKTWQRYQEWVNEHLSPADINAFRFVECPIANPTAMARREVFDLGFRPGPWPEDYDFWLRAIAEGYKVAKLPDHVLDWTDHPKRLTRTHPSFSAEAFDSCRRTHLLSGPLREVKEVNLWGAGLTGKPWLRWLIDQGFNVRCVVDVSPRKVGQTIHSVPVIPPTHLKHADGTPLLIAVGAAGARALILQDVVRKGFVPGRDAWFVA